MLIDSYKRTGRNFKMASGSCVHGKKNSIATVSDAGYFRAELLHRRKFDGIAA